MKKDTHHRTLLKTLSWRIISLIVTFFISWYVTGSTLFAVSISVADTLSKFVMYYMHERAWVNVRWGRKRKNKDRNIKFN
jgi:uncharacterized membrane protein